MHIAQRSPKRFDWLIMELLGYPNPGKNLGLSGTEQKKKLWPLVDDPPTRKSEILENFFKIFQNYFLEFSQKDR